MSAPSPAVKQALAAIRSRIEAALEEIEHQSVALKKAQDDLSHIPHQMDVAIKDNDMKQLVMIGTRMNELQRKIVSITAALNHAQGELGKEHANLARFAGH